MQKKKHTYFVFSLDYSLFYMTQITFKYKVECNKKNIYLKEKITYFFESLHIEIE